MHELDEADAATGIRDFFPQMDPHPSAVLCTQFVGLWKGSWLFVLHVRDKVFMNDSMPEQTLNDKVVLVTGAARRIGAAIVTRLQENGARVAIHYRGSADDAEKLAAQLNNERSNSAAIFQADLLDVESINSLVDAVVVWGGRLDGLVNNASSFYSTPVGSITEAQWTELIGSNLKAPLFLSQAAAQHLQTSGGSIVNIVDIHSDRPLRDHVVYGSAKAGLAMLTRSLAKDLAPDIRVNGVSPGAILWPENGMTEAVQENILEQVPLKRAGGPQDIAGCVLYLLRDATYVTGQIISVDGGRSIGW
jgi:pteridine reductase